MAERKETPDVLGALLGAPAEPAAAPAPPPAAALPAAKAPTPKPAEADKTKTKGKAYLLVGFYNYRGWRLRTVADEQVDGWKRGPTMTDYLVQKSTEGWEVAGMANGENDQILVLLQK